MKLPSDVDFRKVVMMKSTTTTPSLQLQYLKKDNEILTSITTRKNGLVSRFTLKKINSRPNDSIRE